MNLEAQFSSQSQASKLADIAINSKVNMQWPCEFTNWKWRNVDTNELWSGKGLTKIIYHGVKFGDSAKKQAKAGTAMHNQLDLTLPKAELGVEALAVLAKEAELFGEYSKASEVFIAGEIGPVSCVAYADAVVENAKGLHIVDYKFTSKPIKYAEQSCGNWLLQLAGLSKLMYDMHGELPASLSIIGYSKTDKSAFVIALPKHSLNLRLMELQTKASQFALSLYVN